MSQLLSFTHTVEIVADRCFRCRRWYGAERNQDYGCPLCARDELKRLNDRLSTLIRANAALRGAVKRAKA